MRKFDELVRFALAQRRRALNDGRDPAGIPIVLEQDEVTELLDVMDRRFYDGEMLCGMPIVNRDRLDFDLGAPI